MSAGLAFLAAAFTFLIVFTVAAVGTAWILERFVPPKTGR